jgi:hypothetical protein
MSEDDDTHSAETDTSQLGCAVDPAPAFKLQSSNVIFLALAGGFEFFMGTSTKEFEPGRIVGQEEQFGSLVATYLGLLLIPAIGAFIGWRIFRKNDRVGSTIFNTILVIMILRLFL